jgi:hypothetical protein
MQRIMENLNEMLAVTEAERSNTMQSNSSQGPNDEEQGSDNMEEEDMTSESEAQWSPFQPVAGVRGKFPRNWQSRHERSVGG